jgi:hypothetical protein
MIGRLFAAAALLVGSWPGAAEAQAPTRADLDLSAQRALVDSYCVTCHNQAVVEGRDRPASPLAGQLRAVGLALDTLDLADVGTHASEWEKVVRKLRGGVMPPAGRPRPDAETLEAFLGWLEGELDEAWAQAREPGRTATFHRLNRTEYRNAVRDLLAVEIDAVDFFPADDSSFGFDNIGGVLGMSQALLESYLNAARTISRVAVGSPVPATTADTYEAAQDLPQDVRGEGLPFGTRGGLVVEHLFPRDAEYDIQIELTGTRRLSVHHDLEVSIDGAAVRRFTVGPAPDGGGNPYAEASKLEVRVPVSSGPRHVAVAFFKKPAALVEQVREPFSNPRVSGNTGGRAGAQPFVRSVTIVGPFDATGAGDTPSRARIFACRPEREPEEEACARRILSTLARRAYRRPVAEAELTELLAFYAEGRAVEAGSFDTGIEMGLRRLLISPEFLYRIELDPPGVAPASSYPISDLELASRLSFFLWSSIPDDELLSLAEAGRLRDPAELAQQVRRMVTDPRSISLTTNFAAQWLELRNLETLVRPGEPYSVAFDESLRQSMLRETELFFDGVVRGNHSMVELLTADYTFVNERLADHYGLEGVTGSHFRRVALPPESGRAGILGHGSVLTLTSHAIRTSPVLRGKWILNNLLGTPPPDPPPNVPALDDSRNQAKRPTLRARMEQHRDNPACSACHSMIDPPGFALEHFDAIGRWRDVDVSFNAIDASGVLPDGRTFEGVAELRTALTDRPQQFVTTVTEKLMTYGLGRGLDYYDMPTLRRIVREAAVDDYRFHTLILGIVTSDPFLMRRSQS